MKKFTLMILSVSVFFIGVGGVVKHFTAKPPFDRSAPALVFKAPFTVEGEKQINEVRSLTIFDKHKNHLVIKGAGTELVADHLTFNLRVPDQADKTISFPRVKSAEPLKPGKTFLRSDRRNVVIFKHHDGDKLEISEPGDEKELIAEDRKIKIVRENELK